MDCWLVSQWEGGGGGHGPTNCVVITTMSPSDRRCCSCRTFPDNNLYQGKCARRRIVDRWPGSPLQGVGERGWGFGMGVGDGGSRKRCLDVIGRHCRRRRFAELHMAFCCRIVGERQRSCPPRPSNPRPSPPHPPNAPPPPPPFPASHTRQIAAANCEPR